MAGRGRFWCGAVAKNSPSTPTISVTLPPGKIRWRRLSEWPHNAGKSSNALRLPRANAGWITTRFATGKVGTGTSRWPCWPMLCCRCCAHAEKKTPNAQVRLSVPELRHLLTALLWHADLAAGHTAHIGAVSGAARLELGDGLQRKLDARGYFHECVIESGGIYAVQAEIVIFLRKAGKTDGVLGAGAGADGTGNQGLQTRPIPAIHRKLFGLAACFYSRSENC